MDQKTQDYYRNNAREILNRYHQVKEGVSVYFDRAFVDCKTVLDIGCGAGRDLLQLLERGYDAYGLEPCEELIQVTVEKYPQLSGRILPGSLPSTVENLKNMKFDAVLCSAVLMHIPEEDLFDTVYTIRNLLEDRGKLLISIPNSRGDLAEDDRDTTGRLMIMRDPWDIQLLFERTGFQLIEYWENDDSIERENIRWTTMLFSYREEQLVRPIDKIEGVLNRDKKDATYKLALFRAICDIALTEYRRVRVDKGKNIGILLDDIVEKWLIYYWPFVENFIPQKHGESPNSKKKMAFRESLEELTRYYKASGGLQGFILDKRSSKLTGEAKEILKKVYKHIRLTIKKGPIVYSGGALQTGKVFDYNSQTKRVLFSPDLWREFVLMGHWIRDALILRWAELTAKISRNSIKPSEIIDLLLRNPIPERETSDARKIFMKLENKECVWSGKRLKTKFDVDHAIPFSLWMNNDLWNLFPISPLVNNNKRDKLPTTSLVKKRRAPIIDYWKLMRSEMTPRFDYEMERFTGLLKIDPFNWENKLFSHFIEAIEYTAIQRGIERWEP
jgi:SAM-dependent methyltransferase